MLSRHRVGPVMRLLSFTQSSPQRSGSSSMVMTSSRHRKITKIAHPPTALWGFSRSRRKSARDTFTYTTTLAALNPRRQPHASACSFSLNAPTSIKATLPTDRPCFRCEATSDGQCLPVPYVSYALQAGSAWRARASGQPHAGRQATPPPRPGAT
ncbi:Uncharacterised protein [Enterobacter cloacae]|uniref:Uncharacterized protein n=1 Tax=Enterobacter cloacae TaxID=550 RepID=A0A377M892_ENTCL|nr:Uncharacterised protein [Enterobacter cloacae]